MAKARASHILVSTKEKCEDLKTQIEADGGVKYANLRFQNEGVPPERRA